MFRKPLAFIRRDFATLTSYRFAFSLQFFSIFIPLLSFYFISKMFGEVAVPYLQPYGGDYFSFVLIGIAFMGYLRLGLGSFGSTIRVSQVMGTLEVMLVTPTKLSTILISSTLWNFILSSANVLIYLSLGVYIFGVNMSNPNILATIIVLILSIIAFSSIGMISAAFIIVFKKGDPIGLVFGSLSGLLGGVLYPITVLPEWLQNFSHLLPITYSLRAMRHALLQGYPIEALSQDILALVVFSAIMLPISILTFGYAVRKAKMDGSLGQY